MTRLFIISAILTAALALTAPGALGHGYTLGDLAIGHVWTPVPEPGAGAIPVYGPLLNRGDEPATLTAASSAAANEVRFRKVKNGEAVWLSEIAVGPGAALALAPWREHIWLTGLARPLEEGDSFPLTLDFGAAGTITVEVVVEQSPGH